jgi:hypothetical protein
MKAHTKLRIAAGVLAFALGMLGAQLAHGEEGFPNAGDVVDVRFACFPEDTVLKLFAYRSDKQEVSKAEIETYQNNCVATPGGQAVLVDKPLAQGQLWVKVSATTPLVQYYGEAWGLDTDGDGSPDGWTIFLFDEVRGAI